MATQDAGCGTSRARHHEQTTQEARKATAWEARHVAMRFRLRNPRRPCAGHVLLGRERGEVVGELQVCGEIRVLLDR